MCYENWRRKLLMVFQEGMLIFEKIWRIIKIIKKLYFQQTFIIGNRYLVIKTETRFSTAMVLS